ncbi:methyl-accepting chemotaxis protein [Paenibacillus aestuarii]|uniref:Methyl-accepting chemotaxis protein n=1 Tax=Paenibacillus aestuarii TaxID=516965 RepID=A0ABW0KJI4_9BACL|nr:methyl-accepting chemotaxis protein [Paenibacillus aestuarii]
MNFTASRLNRIAYKISVGYVIVIILFLISILSVVRQLNAFQTEVAFITNHDMQVDSLAQSIEKDLVDMETGQRGYVVTNDNKYLAPYNSGKQNWKQHYDELFGMIADNPSQQDKLKVVQQKAEEWIQIAGEDVITMQTNGDTEGVKKFFAEDPGKQVMDDLRNQLATFRATEKELTKERVNVLDVKGKQLIIFLYGSLAVVVIVAAISSFITGSFTSRNVRKVGIALSDIASSGGDLTKRIEVNTKDETYELANEANKLLASLQVMIADIQSSAGELSRSSIALMNGTEESTRASEQIASSVQRVAEGAELQVSQSQEITAIMDETVTGLEQVAATTTDVADLAKHTQKVASQSAKEMMENGDKISKIELTFSEIKTSAVELGRFSDQIKQVVTRIQGISSQTSLLSLNAAIEAARAGEHGRGFAVVAGEIRKLADQAEQSTMEIKDTIETMLGGIHGLVQKVTHRSADVGSGFEAMKNAGNSFLSITDRVNSLSAQVMEVAATVEQMSAGSKSIGTSIKQITKITEETAAFTEEVAAMTEEQTATSQDMLRTAMKLSEMSNSMQILVGKFKV